MPAQDREFTMRFLAGAENRNVYGNVNRGSMMKWMDEGRERARPGGADSLASPSPSAASCSTNPSPSAISSWSPHRLIHTGRTSMHIAVNVCSRNPRHGEYEDTTSCLMVFVALDAGGRPTPVPKWSRLRPKIAPCKPAPCASGSWASTSRKNSARLRRRRRMAANRPVEDDGVEHAHRRCRHSVLMLSRQVGLRHLWLTETSGFPRNGTACRLYFSSPYGKL